MDLLSLLGFSSGVDISVKFSDEDKRKTLDVHTDKGTQRVFVFTGDETVKGSVLVKIPAGKKIEHEGVKVELVGEIGVVYDRGNHHEFTTQVQEISQKGTMQGENNFEFEFAHSDKQYESYNGLNVRLRYFIRFSIFRGFGASNIIKEQELWVINFATIPDINNSVKMEVGIEDCLHIEFEYARSKYHLKDVILGKVYFLLVRIKIKYMEIALVKRESTGTPPNVYNENETMTKFEIMDGAPVRGECVPVRLFLGAFDLTPTYKNIQNKFSVKYSLNLVLVDEEDRRYFKQTDIFLWRKQPSGTEASKVITVRDAYESLAEAKKNRRKKRKEQNALSASNGEGGDEGSSGEKKKEKKKDKKKKEKGGDDKETETLESGQETKDEKEENGEAFVKKTAEQKSE